MPRFIQKQPASASDLRAVEARVIDVLARQIAALGNRVEVLERRLAAIHLHSTCHPEWVAPDKTMVGAIRRARIVESVLSFMDSEDGMSVREIAAYLHLPDARLDILRDDLKFLASEDRARRTSRQQWRIKDSRNAT
jgi:hypothetical protein